MQSREKARAAMKPIGGKGNGGCRVQDLACAECGKRFNKKGDLKRHIVGTGHFKDGQSWPCPKLRSGGCPGGCFFSKGALRQHVKVSGHKEEAGVAVQGNGKDKGKGKEKEKDEKQARKSGTTLQERNKCKEKELRDEDASDDAAFDRELLRKVVEEKMEVIKKEIAEHILKQIDETVNEADSKLKRYKTKQESKLEHAKAERQKLDSDIAECLKTHQANVRRELSEELKKVEAAKKALDDEMGKMKQFAVQQSAKVTLDIGGQLKSTSKSTLCKYDGTMFSAMFSGRHQVTTQEDGSIFIDRSPKHFDTILNYLRDGDVFIPPDARERDELRREAHYYGLTELEAKLA